MGLAWGEGRAAPAGAARTRGPGRHQRGGCGEPEGKRSTPCLHPGPGLAHDGRSPSPLRSGPRGRRLGSLRSRPSGGASAARSRGSPARLEAGSVRPESQGAEGRGGTQAPPGRAAPYLPARGAAAHPDQEGPLVRTVRLRRGALAVAASSRSHPGLRCPASGS